MGQKVLEDIKKEGMFGQPEVLCFVLGCQVRYMRI
jgi:hypothetical protein